MFLGCSNGHPGHNTVNACKNSASKRMLQLRRVYLRHADREKEGDWRARQRSQKEHEYPAMNVYTSCTKIRDECTTVTSATTSVALHRHNCINPSTYTSYLKEQSLLSWSSGFSRKFVESRRAFVISLVSRITYHNIHHLWMCRECRNVLSSLVTSN